MSSLITVRPSGSGQASDPLLPKAVGDLKHKAQHIKKFRGYMIALETYRPSGKTGARAILVALFLGIPLAAMLGYGLAWAQGHAHGFVASAICALLASLVIGIVFVTLADQARSRNVQGNTIGASLLLICLFGVRWWHAEHIPGDALWSLMQAAPVTAWFPRLLGALMEALPVAGMSMILVRSQANAPFSEAASQWAIKSMQGELWAGSVSAPQLMAGLQAQGASLLSSMPRAAEYAAAPLASVWRTVEVLGYWVEADAASRWLTVKIKTHERGDSGKIKVSSEDVVAHWHVEVDAYLAVNACLEGTSAPGQHAEAAQKMAAEPDPTPVELQPALAALQAEQYGSCLSLAQAHCQHPDPAVRADAWRMCGMSSSRLSRWTEAFDHYHHLFELEGHAFNALQLATTSVMAGELLRGEAWFAKAVELNERDSEMPPARLRTAYLSALENAGEYEAATRHLDWLAQGYMAMRITDDTFVWTRGFPFFAEFLRKSQHLLSHALTGADLKAWYERMAASLDEEGQAMLASHVLTIQA